MIKQSTLECIGKKYGKLYIKSLFTQFSNNRHKTYANYICDCGKTGSVPMAIIKCGHTSSCGCGSFSTRFQKNTKNVINDFSIINPESSYWLGFIFGDGNVDNKGKLQIGLASNKYCIKHLKKLSKYIYGYDKTNIYPQVAHLQVSHDKIIENLARFGIIPRKTYCGTLKLPEGFEKDFIRGYFDADGWISIGKQFFKNANKYYDRICFGLCSYNPTNLEIVTNFLPIQKRVRKLLTRNLYEIRYTGKQTVYEIGKFLYGLPNFEYKWKKICKLMNSYQKYMRKNQIIKN